MSIYEYLYRNQRKAQGPTSITALARVLGVSRQTIYWWLDHTHKPTSRHRERLRAVGISKVGLSESQS